MDSKYVLHECTLRNSQLEVKPQCARLDEDLDIIMLLSGSLEHIFLKVKSAITWKLLAHCSVLFCTMRAGTEHLLPRISELRCGVKAKSGKTQSAGEFMRQNGKVIS